MEKLSVLLFTIIVFFTICEGKIFNRCELVRELRRQGFPADQMRDWVCLIEGESSRDTSKINLNSNGSRDHGLFQFNDRFWCSPTNTPGKDCKVTCAEVRTDDITKASTCAKLVYARHKFTKWNAWRDKCQGELPNISNC